MDLQRLDAATISYADKPLEVQLFVEPPLVSGLCVRYSLHRVETYTLGIACSDHGICYSSFTKSAADFEKELRSHFQIRQVSLHKMPEAIMLASLLRGEYTPTTASIRLHLVGSTFETLVWRALLDIPYGTTTTYGAIAKQIGRPGAVRAVGTAIGHNPIVPLIPCHRVLRSDGSLGGYSALGGIETKANLLRKEGILL